MKKIKILLPSIALAVVLMFSITIGVYAASSVSFKVTSTISFTSPDVAAVIKCYVGTDTTGTPAHTWDNNTSGGSTADWTLPANLFTAKDADGGYSDVTLSFVITNYTGISVYAYFANVIKDNSGNITSSTKVTSATIDGNLKENDLVVNPGLLTITFEDEKTLPVATDQTTTLTMTLSMKDVAKADTVTISNYGVYLSKWSTLSST